MISIRPTGWAPTNFDPLTLIGDDKWSQVVTLADHRQFISTRLAQVQLNVTAIVNHTADEHYVRLCGGCKSTSGTVFMDSTSATSYISNKQPA